MQGKKTKGRKRHLIVDTLGLLIEVVVHSASIQDRVAAKHTLTKAKRSGASFTRCFADGGYTGSFVPWAKEKHAVHIEIVKRSDQNKFVILPKRWIVERTISWLNRSRRLAKDVERFAKTVEMWIKLAMTRLMLRRIEQEYTLC